MAGKISNSVNNVFNEIGAMQTLVENFPMSLITFGNLNFSTSFDVLSILFKLFKNFDREKLINKLTDVLCGSVKDYSDGTGFISQIEEIVKMALEANIANVFNCSTNPIISNDLLDYYVGLGEDISRSGNGIVLDVSEIDMMGVLNKNPFLGNNDKFYFDIENYNANSVWKSKDFNAFLWYIINKSDKSQDEEVIWDDRYRASIYGGKKNGKKEIIRCTYIDENYPNSDKIKVQLCGARDDKPANYFKTGFGKTIKGKEWRLNKTIFEFNHEFLSSIKLYEPKVIIAEMVEYLLGTGNLTVNLGFSVNEQIIQGKIQEIIKTVIESNDIEINDCYFSFSNEDYNNMLETSERNRFNIVNNGESFFEVDPNSILDSLSGINSKSTSLDDKSSISKTLYDISAIPAQDPESHYNIDLKYDWSFEIIRMFVYPFIRPLFTPKVMFLLIVNRKIMGEITHTGPEELLKSLFIIIKDIIVKIKDLIVDMFLNFILEELSSLLALFASKLFLETLNTYRSLLNEIFEKCSIPFLPTVGNIDNVNYADITPTKTEPEQTIC